MNIQKLVHTLAEATTEDLSRLSSRRGVLRQWMPRLALASMPVVLSGVFQKVNAKANESVTDLLRLALTFERLESAFYKKAFNTPGLIPAARTADLQALHLIADNEAAHVDFVGLMLTSAGGSADGVPNVFDFSGGHGSGTGPYGNVFRSYAAFLEMAQTLSDLGVRFYKGLLPELMGHNEILQGSLEVQSVEGRHAARLRQMRQENGFANLQPWITQLNSGMANPPIPSVYAGESNTLQAGVDLTQRTGLSSDIITEAFDEPLGTEASTMIIQSFVSA